MTTLTLQPIWFKPKLKFPFSRKPRKKNNKVSFLEKKTEFVITLCLPGFIKDDINVFFRNQELRISGSCVFKTSSSFYFKENTWEKGFTSPFFESFFIPKEIEDDKITISYEENILTVILPKKLHQTKKIRMKIFAFPLFKKSNY